MGDAFNDSGWKPADTFDVNDDRQIRDWARRLCVTPNELREMIEEMGDRPARIATALGLPLRNLAA
jgi:hypothetical protein